MNPPLTRQDVALLVVVLWIIASNAALIYVLLP
jgi:hypothetical protein